MKIKMEIIFRTKISVFSTDIKTAYCSNLFFTAKTRGPVYKFRIFMNAV